MGGKQGTDAIMTATVLRTRRLLLREWRDDDLDAFAVLSSDSDVMQHLLPLDGRAESDAMAARVRRHFAEHGFGFWAVELPGQAAFIGVIGLAVVGFTAHFTPAVEIGWRLGRRYWGQGYAIEAAAAALDDGFGRLRLDEIVAFTVPANEPSWRLMHRLGMTRSEQDDFDHPRIPAGHPLRRHVLYRLDRQSWTRERPNTA
jgi:RimJ/RimL family protein N-acetyltransferase